MLRKIPDKYKLKNGRLAYLILGVILFFIIYLFLVPKVYGVR